MKFKVINPPREFEVGFDKQIRIKDCANINLEPNEQVTFETETGVEYDVTRKSWGFYATPSLNGRLQRFGLRGVLVRNRISQYFVLLVEQGHEIEFASYLKSERLKIISWLDSDHSLGSLEQGVNHVAYED